MKLKSKIHKMRGYILIVIALMLVVCSVNVWFYSTFKKQATDVNEYIKETTVDKVVEFYKQIDTVVMGSIESNDIYAIRGFENVYQVYRSPEMLSLIERIKTLGSTTSNVLGVYIYLEKYGLVLSESGIQSAELFFKTKGKSYAATYEEWLNVFKDNEMIQDFTVHNDNIVYTSFLNTRYKELRKDERVFMGINFDKSKVFPKTPHIEWVNKRNIYVYDISYKLGLYDESSKISSLPEKPQLAEVKHNSDEYDAFFYEVRVNSMPYVIAVTFEKDLNMKTVKYVQLVSNGMILLMCLLTVLFLYNTFVTKFRPIEVISDALGIKVKNLDYRFLEKPIISVVNENGVLNEMLENKNIQLRTLMLNRLLSGEVSGDSLTLLKDYGVNFEYKNFVVIILNLYKDSDITEEQDEAMTNSFENAIDEMLSTENGIPYFIKTKTRFVCVYNTRLENNGLKELALKFAYLSKFLDKDYSFVVSIAVSNVHEGYPGISRGYSEALDVIGRSDLFDKSKVVLYSDINFDENKRFSLADENDLLSAIKNGDSETAVSVVKRVLSGINSDNFSVHNHVVVGLIYSLMRIEDIVFSNNCNMVNVTEILKNTGDVNTVKNQCTSIVSEMCERVRNTEAVEGLASRMKQYIEASYGNDQISAEYLSNVFHYSIIHLNNVFKKEYGITPLAYLNDYRIEKAKEFIVSGMKVSEAAEKSGFTSVRTFNRIFQNTVNMTPTQYKNSQAGSQNL